MAEGALPLSRSGPYGRVIGPLRGAERRPNRWERRMGFLGSLAKAGLAKKAIDEARKPKNQRRLKQLWAKVTSKDGKSRR